MCKSYIFSSGDNSVYAELSQMELLCIPRNEQLHFSLSKCLEVLFIIGIQEEKNFSR